MGVHRPAGRVHHGRRTSALLRRRTVEPEVRVSVGHPVGRLLVAQGAILEARVSLPRVLRRRGGRMLCRILPLSFPQQEDLFFGLSFWGNDADARQQHRASAGAAATAPPLRRGEGEHRRLIEHPPEIEALVAESRASARCGRARLLHHGIVFAQRSRQVLLPRRGQKGALLQLRVYLHALHTIVTSRILLLRIFRIKIQLLFHNDHRRDEADVVLVGSYCFLLELMLVTARKNQFVRKFSRCKNSFGGRVLIGRHFVNAFQESLVLLQLQGNAAGGGETSVNHVPTEMDCFVEGGKNWKNSTEEQIVKTRVVQDQESAARSRSQWSTTTIKKTNEQAERYQEASGNCANADFDEEEALVAEHSGGRPRPPPNARPRRLNLQLELDVAWDLRAEGIFRKEDAHGRFYQVAVARSKYSKIIDRIYEEQSKDPDRRQSECRKTVGDGRKMPRRRIGRREQERQEKNGRAMAAGRNRKIASGPECRGGRTRGRCW